MNEYISDQSTPYRTIIPYPPTNKKDGPCGGRPPPSVGEPPPVCGGRSPPFPAGGGRVGVAPYEEGGPPPIIFLIFAQTRYPGTWGKEFLHGFSDIGTAVQVHMVPGNHGRNSWEPINDQKLP